MKKLLKNKKGAEGMPWYLILILIALIGLAWPFWDRIAYAKDTISGTLGIGEKCQETGTTYEQQVRDLKVSITKERYEEAKKIYMSLKKCFPDKENDLKKDTISYFNSLVKTNIIDQQGFLDFIKFLDDNLGEDSSQIKTKIFDQKLQQAYLKIMDIIEKQHLKVNENINAALNPEEQPSKFQNIEMYSDLAKEEFEKLKELCQKYKNRIDKIKRYCESISKIEFPPKKIDCLYWKELAIFEHELDVGLVKSKIVTSPPDYLVDAYVLYTYTMGKYGSSPECNDIVREARLKRVELIQSLSDVNKFYTAVCDYFQNVPGRGKYINNAGVSAEIKKIICGPTIIGGSCNACKNAKS